MTKSAKIGISETQLSSEQIEFITKALEGKNILVDTCIGSGKTTAIQYLCNALPSNKRILYLTYNRLLKNDAQNKITNNNVTVTNYHGFAMATLHRISIKSSVSDCIRTFNNIKPSIDVYRDSRHQGGCGYRSLR